MCEEVFIYDVLFESWRAEKRVVFLRSWLFHACTLGIIPQAVTGLAFILDLFTVSRHGILAGNGTLLLVYEYCLTV